MFTRRTVVNDVLVPIICMASPVVCYFLKQNEKEWLGGYAIGTELLIINAGIAFLLLFIFSKKDSTISVLTENERPINQTEAARLDGNQSAF